jgi:hypothetical protein
MRTFEEMDRDAREGSPFSNGTEGECWTANWCGRCVHDKAFREGKASTGCDLMLIALCGKTPVEWMRQDGHRLGDQYHCIEFRDERDGPKDPPKPPPQIPGQGLLFDAEPYEGVRMFADVVDEIRPAEVRS